ncbi:hypothetical protein HGRIS_011920 [Hohenbuehelia grisea]|uniref:Uncharacterized protein n=1 Tax=Hohenbuehelia grisea TaxID=104357 RepID=A0ABR3JYB4_9AGAR
MVKKVDGWIGIVVRVEDPSATSTSSETDSAPAIYEQSLDRVACALGGRTVLPPAFQLIPSMLANFDWRVRHAGLMSIVSIAEGTGKVMMNELGKVVDLVTPHVQCLTSTGTVCGVLMRLCTDLEEIIQEKYHQQLFDVLIPTLEDTEPRRQWPSGQALRPRTGHHERCQAMVADASESTFAKFYPLIMPLLLNVLRNADGAEFRKLRAKAMECAGLIAIASLELTLPSLKFYFHEGVREVCAVLVPVLLACGKTSNALTNQMVSARSPSKELALMEEIEDMGKMLQLFDANHPLPIAVSSVRDLGFNSWDSEDEGDEEG